MISVAAVAVCSKTQKRLFVDAVRGNFDNSDVERDESTADSIDSDDSDGDDVDFEIKSKVKSCEEPLDEMIRRGHSTASFFVKVIEGIFRRRR